ncbi:ATP-dependent DNA helicase PIF1-like protein [Tanacetum coccineum]
MVGGCLRYEVWAHKRHLKVRFISFLFSIPPLIPSSYTQSGMILLSSLDDDEDILTYSTGENEFFYSFDEAEEVHVSCVRSELHIGSVIIKEEDVMNNFYLMKFLNSLNVSRFPPHYLHLKNGSLVVLLRNLDSGNGLCNRTRLTCKPIDPNVISAEITVAQHAGIRVLLLRIPLAPSEEDMFPFKLKRRQFMYTLALR